MIKPEPGFTVLKYVAKDTTRASGLIVPGQVINLVVVADGNDEWTPDSVVIASLKDGIKYECDNQTYMIVPSSAIMATVV